ncbi:MAG: amidohydrolase, partial [Burkholderiales bacterium PBB5]
PHSADVFWNQARHLSDEVINKITHLNAMREFRYDPFSVLGRENCTVGALRAQAGHVVTEPALGLGGAAPERDAHKPVTSGDINRMFASADAQTAL